MMRARLLTIAVACVAALVTLLVTVLPFLRFAYRSPSAHLALDVTATLVSLLAAFLVFGRFRRSHTRADAILTFSLALFAATNFLFSTVPALGGRALLNEQAEVWAPVSGRILATVLLAASPFVNPRRIRDDGRVGWIIAGVVLGTLLLLGVAFNAFADDLPVALDQDISPDNATRPLLVGHSWLLGSQLLTCLLFAVAAFGFSSRSERDDDELMRWVAVAAVLAAFARVNYFLYPSLYSDFVYVGDFFRLGFYVVLSWGGVVEIRYYWKRFSEAAVLEERRRIARDLHDGLGQELAYIWTQTRRGVDEDVVERFERISGAAERAIDESRRAIAALSMPIDQPLDKAISQTAFEVAHRLGARVVVDLDPDVIVTTDTREALLRIVREAVSNAARHAEATTIKVDLRGDKGISLRITDNGKGFVNSDDGRGGFGLTSMKERAHSVGADFRVSSRVGEGSEVEVVLS